jgi:hypothetical protein
MIALLTAISVVALLVPAIVIGAFIAAYLYLHKSVTGG